jgi:hypothetical protein
LNYLQKECQGYYVSFKFFFSGIKLSSHEKIRGVSESENKDILNAIF